MGKQSPSSKSIDRKLPWILRVSPQRYREKVMRIGLYFGVVCELIWMTGAFFGLIFGPIIFAIWRPEAPLSQPVLWLHRVSGPDAFEYTYPIVMLLFAVIVQKGRDFLHHVLSVFKTPNNQEPGFPPNA